MSDNSLRALQMEELRILCAIRDVCQKYGLTYYLAYGTLLGAVRHQGFIPWDDDADIIMPYEDYCRFLQGAQSELDPDFFVQNCSTDPNFYGAFTKVRSNGTTAMGYNSEKYAIHHGVWVDIFPLAPVGSDREHAIKKKIVKYSNLLQMDNFVRASRDDIEKEFGQKALKLLGILFVLPMGLRKAMHQLALKSLFLNKKAEYVAEVWNSLGAKYHTDYLGSGTELEFEGESFTVPARYHEYLELKYGDYMTLPPEEKRKTHGLLIVDLEKDYKFYMK